MSADDNTMKPGLNVSVTDHFQAPQTYVSGPRIYALSCMAHSDRGYEYPTGWTDVTEAIGSTVSDDAKTVTFTTQAPKADACSGVENSQGAPDTVPAPYALEGTIYVVSWVLNNSNHALGGKQTLTNLAYITIDGFETAKIDVAQEIQLAGGSGGGDMNNAIPSTPTVSAAECGPTDTGLVWESLVLPEGGFFTYDLTTDADHVATVVATPIPGATLSKSDLGEGWVVNEDGTATWTYQLGSKVCDSTVVPVVPVVTPAECTVDTQGKKIWENVTQPVNGGGITYGDVAVDDSHVATVVATLDEGHVFGDLGEGWVVNEDGTATWTYQLGSKVCDSTVVPVVPVVTETGGELAKTGGDLLPMWVTAGAMLLLISGAVLGMRARRGAIQN